MAQQQTWEDTRTIPGTLTKQDIYDLLDARGIEYEAVEHPPVCSVEEADAMAKLPFAEHEAKNFFLRDPKHREYYLVTVPDHKKVDLKRVQAELESKRLSFASADDLAEKIGIYRVPSRPSPRSTPRAAASAWRSTPTSCAGAGSAATPAATPRACTCAYPT